MSWTYYLRRAISLPPGEVCRRAWAMWAARRVARRERRRDAGSMTFSIDAPPRGSLSRFVVLPPTAVLHGRGSEILPLVDRVMRHEFSLLGSGWIKVEHGGACAGFEGITHAAGDRVTADADGHWLEARVSEQNLAEAKRRWELISALYSPIDWQRDFRSGYRWSEMTQSRDIVFADIPGGTGADIKLPWELARMQHLTWLAWAYTLAANGEPRFESPARYAAEIENQIIDFAATNPPRFGVNWVCTMDVAIRAANWVIACDLLLAAGHEPSENFTRLLTQSLHEHASHIVSHLEWRTGEARGNHYLADVVGLLAIAAYLPADEQADDWLRFAAAEFMREVSSQFQSDGSHFEASTSYHRLAAEMMVCGAALIAAMKRQTRRLEKLDGFARAYHGGEPAPLAPIGDAAKLNDKLRAAARFTLAATGPDGLVTQIGDNDSGRFLKLWPVDDSRDHRHLLAAIHGIAPSADLLPFIANAAPETTFVQGLATGSFTPAVNIAAPGGPRPRLESFPDFGLFVHRRGPLELTLRCGPIGRDGTAGHAHNDQLSLEFSLHGKRFALDPGTFVYTAATTRRNHFRSTAMHNTLSLTGHEQSQWLDGTHGLFLLNKRASAGVQRATENDFLGVVNSPTYTHSRAVTLHDDRFEVVDRCETAGQKAVSLHLAPGVIAAPDKTSKRITLQLGGVEALLECDSAAWAIHPTQMSPGYGELIPSLVCRVSTMSSSIAWSVRFGEAR